MCYEEHFKLKIIISYTDDIQDILFDDYVISYVPKEELEEMIYNRVDRELNESGNCDIDELINELVKDGYIDIEIPDGELTIELHPKRRFN